MDRRTTGFPQALAAFVPGLVRSAFGRRGFVESAVLTQWSSIVGDELGQRTAPEKLAFSRRGGEGAVLHIRVPGAYAVELQHLAPTVIERVNRYFGYRAVARLALTQGPVVPPEPRPAPRPRAAAVADSVTSIADEGLRGALARLAAAIQGAEGGVER